MRRTLVLTAAAITMVGTLAACSSEEEPMVGGMTECTDEIINEEATKTVDANSGGENEWQPDSVQCADGWALASGIIAMKDAPADGPQGAPANLIFQQEGQFWIPKDPVSVCGTYGDGTYPSDAEIPEALYSACTSG